MKKIVFVLLLAALLRLYNIGNVPPSPSLDEVSIGYNAHSILKTGADEYGTKFPLLLRAYDDWRPALYVYFVIPFVWILGLTATAVRLPSVIFSIITVYITYLLAKEIFDEKRWVTKISNWTIDAPLVAALLLAVSPWHIYLSRLGHEVSLGLAFIVFGVFAFLRAIHNKKQSFLLICSAFFFGLSLYTYQSQKVIVPVFVLTLVVLFWRDLWSRKKQLILAGIVGLILLIPVVFISVSPEALIRLQGTSAFINNPLYIQSSLRLLKAHQNKDLIGVVLNNRRIVTTQIFLTNYISHFDPRWLFLGKNQESHKVPWLGLLYPWELPLIFFGLITVFKKFPFKIKSLLLVWLFSAPIPGSFTTQAPHAMRSYTFLPVLQFLSAAGLLYLIQLFKKKVIVGACIITVLLSIVYFYFQYFVTFPMTQSDSFQYALAQAIVYVNKNEGKYKKVIFSNTFYDKNRNPYQSYMFFLFLNGYDPKTYQSQGGTKSGGYDQTHEFGKFEFRPIRWESEGRSQSTLYIGNANDFSSNTQTIFVGNNLDGTPAVMVAQ